MGAETADEGVDEVARALGRARRVLVVTGAGMSADSGLPTYRGVGGLYVDADTEEGVPIEVALSGPTLRANPALCWRHIARIEAACRGAAPHAGHRVLAALQERAEVVILTQNVDGLHQAAGSRDVIEIHGNVHDLECRSCGWSERVADYAGLAAVPRCPRCDAVIRPAVVLFGELLPQPALARLAEATARPFDLVLCIGTTAVFPYVVAPVVNQARAGGDTAEIDPGETALSRLVRWRIRAGAAEALARIGARLA